MSRFVKVRGSGTRILRKRGSAGRRRRTTLITIIFMALLIPTIVSVHFLWRFSGSGSGVNMLRAAIVDGLALTRPNPSFTSRVKETLEGAGLSVDIYEGEDVTIDLLRGIGGYGLLILRLHSAVDEKYGFLYLFSAERFNKTLCEIKFGEEYSKGIIREGKTFENESYFALMADFLGYMNWGGLDGSIIILMGCSGASSSHAINRLLNERGVRAVIAWDGYVDLEYTDMVAIKLIEEVYARGLSFEEAVEKVMEEHGPDPIWKSKLRYLTKQEA